FVDWDPTGNDVDALVSAIKEGIQTFKEEYIAYFNRNKWDGDSMFEPVPRVLLIPGIGMINTGKSWSAANVSESLYDRTTAVMRGVTILGSFVSWNEAESSAVEYSTLELYKLALARPEAAVARKVAFVTGGAGGIGSATRYRLVSEGAHVALTDINLGGAEEVATEINKRYGANRAFAVKMDVTKEEEVKAAIQSGILKYGGLDIIVNNAGLASSSPFEETTLDKWNLNMNVLVTGYFLVA